ncbi:alpha/beta hydrolase [Chloroflexota bacterium]
MIKTKYTFPVGYHEFNKDKGLNFQLNRYYSMGNATFEDMEQVGRIISSIDDWKTEMLKLAEIAVSEGNLMKAAVYHRAAEFFVLRDNPDKGLLYGKFIDLFYKATQDDGIRKYEVPYNDTFLPVMKVTPEDTKKRGTIVLHGGNDSFIEEIYPIIRYFADHAYEVIAFEGPGQGAALKKYGLALNIAWEKPTEAVLDYFNLDDVTLLGISMGG